jgi:predicted AAA+ superfamily ATPase
LLRDLDSASGLVMLDDVDNYPEVFSRVRQLIDNQRNVKFLLIGSDFLPTLSKLSRDLMGRFAHYKLGGLTLADVGTENFHKHWFRGGLPASFLSSDDNASTLLKKEYLSALPYSSVFTEEFGGSPLVLGRLISILPKYSGVIKFERISRVLDVSSATAKKYVDILSAFGFVRLIESFSAFHGRAVRKEKKIFVRDSGLFSWLLGVQSQGELINHKLMPLLWEAYVIEQFAELIYKEYSEDLFFWDDRSGLKLDALWEHQGSLIGIEIQAKLEPLVTKNMKMAIADLGVEQIITIYMGTTVRELDKNIVALPLNALEMFLGQSKDSAPSPISAVSIAKPVQIFISYSHLDDVFVKSLVDALESKTVGVTVDYKALRLGGRIDEFIRTAVQTTEWTVLVVSANSIRSPWVMAEFLETVLHERARGRNRLLPITLDNCVFELGLQIDLDKELEGRITEVNDLIKQALDRHMDIDRFVGVRRRLLDLRNNIGKALEKLSNVLVGDFADPTKFNDNINKLVIAMKDGE